MKSTAAILHMPTPPRQRARPVRRPLSTLGPAVLLAVVVGAAGCGSGDPRAGGATGGDSVATDDGYGGEGGSVRTSRPGRPGSASPSVPDRSSGQSGSAGQDHSGGRDHGQQGAGSSTGGGDAGTEGSGTGTPPGGVTATTGKPGATPPGGGNGPTPGGPRGPDIAPGNRTPPSLPDRPPGALVPGGPQGPVITPDDLRAALVVQYEEIYREIGQGPPALKDETQDVVRLKSEAAEVAPALGKDASLLFEAAEYVQRTGDVERYKAPPVKAAFDRVKAGGG